LSPKTDQGRSAKTAKAGGYQAQKKQEGKGKGDPVCRLYSKSDLKGAFGDGEHERLTPKGGKKEKKCR